MVDIRHRVGVRAPVEKVYEAIATPEGVAAWWVGRTRADPHDEDTLRIGDDGFMAMKVLTLHPYDRVEWEVTKGPEEWMGTRILFDLKQEDDYAIVVFTHAGWKEPIEFMHHCSTKWGTFLMSLKALVENGSGNPAPNDVSIGNWA